MMIMKGYLLVSRLICFTEHFQAKLTQDGKYRTPLNGEVGVYYQASTDFHYAETGVLFSTLPTQSHAL